MPTPGTLAMNLLLGSFGLAYFVYGKKNCAIVPLCNCAVDGWSLFDGLPLLYL